MDGSLRWVHLIFQSHYPVNGNVSITLASGIKAPSPKQTVKVSESNDRFLLDMGAIAFKVRKRDFNVIDAMKNQDEQITEAHERGLCIKVEDEEYCAVLDPNGELTLEERISLHAVLRATGSLRN